MIRLRSFQIYLFFLTAFGLVACKDRKQVDVSGIQLDVNIERFDRDMSTLAPGNLHQKVPQLRKKYGNFYFDFIQGMLAIGNPADTAYYRDLRTVLTDKDYLELKNAVAKKFPDLKMQEEGLTKAFKHIRYYYPQQKLPRVIGFFSGFSVQTPIGNDYIGIGLDMFLGANAKFYPALRESIPQYISRRFTPENITPRVIETLIREEMFPERDEDRSLMQKMIYNGKVLYLMNAVMPDLPDSLIVGYTTKQMEWSKTYEADIWAYFLEENLLYETDYMKIQKYLIDAPFTPGLGEKNESAPKLAVFTGWQIVKKYMDENPNITLQQLMQEMDHQKILNQSKYKPKQ